MEEKLKRRYGYWVRLPGLGVPAAVFLLLLYPDKLPLGAWTRMLPAFHASVNGLTAVLLIAAWCAIKKNKKTLHKRIMCTCVGLGFFFILSYGLFHLSTAPTRYGDADRDGVVSSAEREKVGMGRYAYLFVLISHIVLAAPVVFLVFKALFYAYHKDFEQHKKTVRYAFPAWLYVSVTGVLVYLMIAPYYPHP